MKKTFYSIIVGMFFPVFIQAQLLTPDLNLPRQGDRLQKHRVASCEPGQRGSQQVWDFSNIELQDSNYELSYTAQGADTIIGIEHQTMYYYCTSGDSLFCIGYENPTTSIVYHKPELLLSFPVFQDRSVTSYFNGSGIYCGQQSIRLSGKSKIAADASGMMILPEGDTLHKVLRIYTEKLIHQKMTPITPMPDSLQADCSPFFFNCDSIDYLLADDSIHLKTETWRWYAEGYRYPVFETMKSTIYKYGIAHNHFTTSFLYLPDEQYYDLPPDSDNQQQRDLVTDEHREREWRSISDDEEDINSNNVTNYSLRKGEDGNLLFRYRLTQSSVVSWILYDLQGRQLTTVRRGNQIVGEYLETISISQYPKGEYLLRINLGEQAYTEKIFK